MKNLFKILFLVIWTPGLALASSSSVPAQTAPEIPWQKIETKYTVIRYVSLKDLEKFNQKVDYSPGEWCLKRLFANAASGNLADGLGKKMDGLYKRVQQILGMHKQTQKVFINLYPDKHQMVAVYNKMNGSAFSAYNTLSEPRAWYLYESNTIYVNVNDLRAGMLAHEMAHAVIDNFLAVRPPKDSAEILARYVDRHLYSD